MTLETSPRRGVIGARLLARLTPDDLWPEERWAQAMVVYACRDWVYLWGRWLPPASMLAQYPAAPRRDRWDREAALRMWQVQWADLTAYVYSVAFADDCALAGWHAGWQRRRLARAGLVAMARHLGRLGVSAMVVYEVCAYYLCLTCALCMMYNGDDE